MLTGLLEFKEKLKAFYAKGGIYTEMFDKQARFYRDKPSESDGDEECD